MRTRTSLVLAALTIFVSSIVLAQPAGALDLYKIHGHVTDAVGRPLAGVTVRNGGQVTTTDANGDYSLGQSSTGTFTLRASRGDLDANTRTVTVLLPVDTAADFTMLYRTVGLVDHPFLSTQGGPASTTVNVTSWAPNPGVPGETGGKSCVGVLDSRTGQTTSATYVSTNAGGEHLWQWTLTVPQATAEQAYSVTYTAADCSSGAPLTATSAASYLIDNTAPGIDSNSIVPLAASATIFVAQPLLARTEDDGGAGVDPASGRFLLVDTTAGTSTEFAATYDAATKWLRTAPVQLTSGHLYEVTAGIADNAGNKTTASTGPVADGGGFGLATFSSPGTHASIPSTPCTLSSQADTTGMRTATCSDVPLHMDATSVNFGPVRQPDVGYLYQTAALDGAVVTTTVAGVPLSLPAYRGGDPGWTPRTGWMRFDVLQVTTTVTAYAVAAANSNIGTLVTKVPATWTSASLSMPSVSTTATTTACADPSGSASTTYCVPDPIHNRFVVTLKSTVADPSSAITAIEARYGASLLFQDATDQHVFTAYVPSTRLSALGVDSNVSSVQREGRVKVTVLTTAPATGGSRPDDLFPTVADTFRILNNGDCANLQVSIRLLGDPDPHFKRTWPYEVTPGCIVTPGAIMRERVTPAGSPTDALGDLNGGEAGGAASPGLRSNATASGTCGSYRYNVHHSEQARRDIINIIVAQLYLDNLRFWTDPGRCAGYVNWVWYGYDGFPTWGWVEQHTYKSWNHPTGVDFPYFGQGCHYWGPCGNNIAIGHGHFHTDFLQCNGSANSQEFDLYNRNYDNDDGTYYTDFGSNVPCFGLHNTTSVWTDLYYNQPKESSHSYTPVYW